MAIYADTGRTKEFYWLGYGNAQNGYERPQGMSAEQQQAYEEGYADGMQDKENS